MLRDKLAFVRAAALIGVAGGAAGSLGLMLYAGRRLGSPPLLLLLFAIWVLSPFAALAVAHVVSERWSVLPRATLHVVTLVVTAASLALYAIIAFGEARPRPAGFVIMPPLCWLLIATAVPAAAFVSRRSSRPATP